MPAKHTAEIGMFVRFTRDNNPLVPHGASGVIDVVDATSGRFWVAVDDGAFFGWTDFDSWELTGERLPREDHEGWYAAREAAL